MNLSSITPGSITGATVSLLSITDYVPNAGELNLYDYTATSNPRTDSNALANLTSGDLIGTLSVGVVYAGYQHESVTLNAQGIADLNAADGGTFIVGGYFNGAGGYLFGNTGNEITPLDEDSITLTTQAIPEPSTWAILAMGGAGLLIFGLRRRMVKV